MKKLLLLLALLVAGWLLYRSLGSGPKEETKAPTAAVVPTPKQAVEPGKAVNAAFPKSADGLDVKFTQEKDGYAQADLMKGAKKLAQLSVSDTNSNPSARDKFKDATKKIAGHPAAAVGSQGTAVLLGNRIQVQVRSLDSSFTPADREAWIAKFNLGALAQ